MMALFQLSRPPRLRLAPRLRVVFSGALAAFGLVLALAACAESGTPTPTPTLVGIVVALDEWSVINDFDAVSAGGVRFEATNGGIIEHELVILRTELPADALVVTQGRVDEDVSGLITGRIPANQLRPGATSRITLTLSPGQYVLLCNIAGHYEAGMHAGFTIE